MRHFKALRFGSCIRQTLEYSVHRYGITLQLRCYTAKIPYSNMGRIQIQKQKEAHVVANAVYSDLCEDLCLQRKCIKIFAIAAGVIPGILLAAPMENGLTACSFSCASFDNPYTSE